MTNRHWLQMATAEGLLREATESEKTELMEWGRLLARRQVVTMATGYGAAAARLVLQQTEEDIDQFVRTGKLAGDPLQEARTLLDVIEACSMEDLIARITEHPPSPKCIAFLVVEIARLSLSTSGSNASKAKNKAARDWVLAEWNRRADKGQSKASFAAAHAALVKKNFDVDIRPGRIASYWLPKG